MFSIGPYQLKNSVLLAPMAGVTDLPFRKLCRAYGAGLATAEMLTSDTSMWSSEKSRTRLDYTDEPGPISVQIAGTEPMVMADAAKMCVEKGAQIIDINMGCPAKKVCKKAAGSALLKDEALVKNILTTVVNSVDVPVTLKTRTGWDTANKNITEVAKIAEDAGISALTIHGRTRACRFEGNAEYATIARVVEQVSIPVIANGDIDSPEKASFVINETNAAGIMIGRPAWGNPWLLEEINNHFAKKKARTVTYEESSHVIETHFNGLYELYGQQKGLRIARKHFAWYGERFGLTAQMKARFNQTDSIQTQIDIVQQMLERYFNQEEKAA